MPSHVKFLKFKHDFDEFSKDYLSLLQREPGYMHLLLVEELNQLLLSSLEKQSLSKLLLLIEELKIEVEFQQESMNNLLKNARPPPSDCPPRTDTNLNGPEERQPPHTVVEGTENDEFDQEMEELPDSGDLIDSELV